MSDLDRDCKDHKDKDGKDCKDCKDHKDRIKKDDDCFCCCSWGFVVGFVLLGLLAISLKI